MSERISLTLDESFSRFVEGEIAAGRYGSASDVVQAALRLLQEEERLQDLRAALIEGEESGPATPFDFESYVARKRKGKPQAR